MAKSIPELYTFIEDIAHDIGEYKWSAASNDFGKWLMCDGRSVSRSSYHQLYDVIGTSFGSNDDFTFRLPDFRGRVMGAVGQGDGLTNRILGMSVGEEMHVLSPAEMPPHSHTGVTASNGSHTHTVTDPGHAHTQTTINDDFNNSGGTGPSFAADSAGTQTWTNINTNTTGITVDSAGLHAHAFTTNTVGGGAAHNNMQPTLFAGNCFIYAGMVPPV